MAVALLAAMRLGGTAQAALDPLWGVGFDDALESPNGLAAALSTAQAANWTHPLHIRLAVRRSVLEPVAGSYDFSALDARLADYRRLSAVDVYLDIRAARHPLPKGWRTGRGLCARWPRTSGLGSAATS